MTGELTRWPPLWKGSLRELLAVDRFVGGRLVLVCLFFELFSLLLIRRELYILNFKGFSCLIIMLLYCGLGGKTFEEGGVA